MRSPTRRAALAACVALLLVTAGCSGGMNLSTTTTTATTTTTTSDTTSTVTATTASATTTTSGTWSPNASVEQYPPGVADNGTLTNASRLVDAHFDATANQSMALTFESTGANDSNVLRYAHGASPTPYYSTLERTTDGERIVQELYRTDSRDYVKTALPDETRYSVLQNDTFGFDGRMTRDGIAGPRTDLRIHLAGGNYSVNGTVERDGQTFVQFTADEVSSSPPGFLTAYEGTALVTPDGVVHGIDASFGTGPDNTTEERFESSITLDTDAEWSGPPSWVGDVPHLSVSIVEDGHAVEIRNTGGTALPANASFDVFGENETVWGHLLLSGDVNGTVTTDVPLEPGDAVYVTAGADGDASSVALHDEPTRGEYTFGYAGLRGTNENVVFRLATGFKSAEDE